MCRNGGGARCGGRGWRRDGRERGGQEGARPADRPGRSRTNPILAPAFPWIVTRVLSPNAQPKGTFLLPANLPPHLPRTSPAPSPHLHLHPHPPAPASYHKTGTGKTYTMGILGNVTNQHVRRKKRRGEKRREEKKPPLRDMCLCVLCVCVMYVVCAVCAVCCVRNAAYSYKCGFPSSFLLPQDGIVPRALGHIFGHMGHTATNTHWAATLSFLQIYLESIQDLLSPKLEEAQRDWESAGSRAAVGAGSGVPRTGEAGMGGVEWS